MKYLYNKKGFRKREGERHQFAFFAVGAFVILAIVFVIGLQVGRVIERRSSGPEGKAAKGAIPSPARPAPSKEDGAGIRKEMGTFSEDAAKVPVVPPPDAKTAVGEVEKRVTFQDSLPRKEDRPIPLVRSGRTDNGAESRPAAAKKSGGGGYVVQAGAFREKSAAEACRRKLETAGYSARIVKPGEKSGETLYRVVLGPFAEKGAARRTVRKLKTELNIAAFIPPG